MSPGFDTKEVSTRKCNNLPFMNTPDTKTKKKKKSNYLIKYKRIQQNQRTKKGNRTFLKNESKMSEKWDLLRMVIIRKHWHSFKSQASFVLACKDNVIPFSKRCIIIILRMHYFLLSQALEKQLQRNRIKERYSHMMAPHLFWFSCSR